MAGLLLLPGQAQAQEPADPWGPPLEAAPKPAGPATFELPVATAVIAGANWLDVRSTQQLVEAGGREAWNPGLYGPKAERIVPVKLVVVAGEVGAFHLFRKWRKEAAWAWVGVIVVGNILIARRNAQITDRLQAQELAHTPQVPISGFQISFSW